MNGFNEFSVETAAKGLSSSPPESALVASNCYIALPGSVVYFVENGQLNTVCVCVCVCVHEC